ncbi:hypothetical protein ACLBYG_19320 [Methylobacterium sp. D53M]|jgi:hypothetical protein
MAETNNTALIAEIISDDIFPEFGWNKVGPINEDWECVKKNKHHKETHPSDVVFFYKEPFGDSTTYVQTDLKSCAAGSISKHALTQAIVSLAMQVSCAESSPGWQDRYLHGHSSFQICGMLFVFNHDGGYDQTFDDILLGLELPELDLPENAKIVVLGPVEIHWLYNVSQEIIRMRGKAGAQRLPERDKCSFFYPQPVTRIMNGVENMAPATLEVLTSPWVVLKYPPTSADFFVGYLIFYRGRNETTEEYLYLIDFLRQHEMLHERIHISIKSIDQSGKAPNLFQKARQMYVEKIGGAENKDGIHKYINSISYSLINAIVPEFSRREVGMNYDR